MSRKPYNFTVRHRQSIKNLDELKKDLRRGELKLVIEISDVKLNTVEAIFHGKRNPNSKNGKKARAAAERLIESRKLLLAGKNTSEYGDAPSREVA
ncbi:hypothetical protein H9Q13_17900 [Pontibacter sp. JH31]|uniref:Uncharacterized protein n=1 Tax=Pontibacter aquaedesilientis TaxID=2766980 RepID=A0ABR7XL97_9BACT|nr:hypothetical protein [Pontibacter aquaedesilientis]MBD1399045.1 hypothetical protein [Pontibacter aquaedesilientis]